MCYNKRNSWFHSLYFVWLRVAHVFSFMCYVFPLFVFVLTYHRNFSNNNTWAPLEKQELLTIPDNTKFTLGFLWHSCCSIWSVFCRVLSTINYRFVLLSSLVLNHAEKISDSDYDNRNIYVVIYNTNIP